MAETIPETADSLPCIACAAKRLRLVVSLGEQPLANSYVNEAQLGEAEPLYPLDLFVCEACFHVQIQVVATSQDIFSDYLYFSSFSTTWLEHAACYVDTVTPRFGLDENAFVVEIASNDGYLLRNFKARGIPCLGIEPAQNIAQVALEQGIETQVAFWGADTAREMVAAWGSADLIIGNNVLAHTPELNDFVAGVALALKEDGVATFEFPHLLRLIEERQFDTIYHEHFSYFSFLTVAEVFARHGLRIFDVEALSTHGGSLRIYACHTTSKRHIEAPAVAALKAREEDAGLRSLEYYNRFGTAVAEVKETVLAFLHQAKKEGNTVAAYGAPAKGNTLLNYCGVDSALISYTVDRNPHKRGQYLPGSHIPILAPEIIATKKPDYLFILPWNLREEIMEQMQHIRDWEGRFVTPIPTVQIWE